MSDVQKEVQHSSPSPFRGGETGVGLGGCIAYSEA